MPLTFTVLAVNVAMSSLLFAIFDFVLTSFFFYCLALLCHVIVFVVVVVVVVVVVADVAQG